MDSPSDCKHINPAAAAIRAEIQRDGPIPFARFMEMALYHPDFGYYRHSHIGKSGDFFTSVSVGSLFGGLLGFFMAAELEKIPGPVQLVEAGANDGSLARDILAWLAEHRPDLSSRLDYWIVEPLRELESLQRRTLAGRRVDWAPNLEALPDIRGAFVCNELLDAFPAHLFRWSKQERRWFEAGVAVEGEGFEWATLPAIPGWAANCLNGLAPLEPHLPDGFQAEFSPAAERWWRHAALKLNDGLMLGIDYGDEALQLWSPARARGTLRAFRNHRLAASPLDSPGGQDLTCSVNFSRIREAGESAGLSSAPLQSQATFLTRMAPAYFGSGPAATRQFQTLTHPEHLGRAFKVLLQRRNGHAPLAAAAPQ